MQNFVRTRIMAPGLLRRRRGTTMDVEEALNSRRSVRAFLHTPVPRTEVERVLALAAKSASNSNSQPWQVHVLTGEAKSSLTAALLQSHDNGGRAAELEYGYQPRPDAWVEPYKSRRREFGERLYGETLGIAATDLTGRLAHHRRNYDFFGAPVGMFLTVSRSSLGGGLIDAGLFLQALMLAARARGLDTCTQASFIDFHPILRRHLSIPEDQIIVCGVSLGYADPRHRLNRLSTSREAVKDFAIFYGDEETSADTAKALRL
jgi:nitroreductase